MEESARLVIVVFGIPNYEDELVNVLRNENNEKEEVSYHDNLLEFRVGSFPSECFRNHDQKYKCENPKHDAADIVYALADEVGGHTVAMRQAQGDEVLTQDHEAYEYSHYLVPFDSVALRVERIHDDPV